MLVVQMDKYLSLKEKYILKLIIYLYSINKEEKVFFFLF